MTTEEAIKVQARLCRAVLNDPTSAECAKAEARAELKRLAALSAGLRQARARGAGKRVAAVRLAIRRLYKKLKRARRPDGRADRVLRAFARHLGDYLLVPSSRYGRREEGRRRAGVAGCLIYEPPEGVRWEG